MKQTLKEFMNDFEGFDFENGTIVIVRFGKGESYIIEKGSVWSFILDKYENETVYNWNCSKNVMVITLMV